MWQVIYKRFTCPGRLKCKEHQKCLDLKLCHHPTTCFSFFKQWLKQHKTICPGHILLQAKKRSNVDSIYAGLARVPPTAQIQVTDLHFTVLCMLLRVRVSHDCWAARRSTISRSYYVSQIQYLRYGIWPSRVTVYSKPTNRAPWTQQNLSMQT